VGEMNEERKKMIKGIIIMREKFIKKYPDLREEIQPRINELKEMLKDEWI
jgi:hypothetical protein